MSSKKQNHAVGKRRLRRKEKQSDAKRDTTMGRAARRSWGMGNAK